MKPMRFLVAGLLVAAAVFIRLSHFDSGLTFYRPHLTRFVPFNAILFWVLLLAAGYIVLQFEIRHN
jgi:hypothetical protein